MTHIDKQQIDQIIKSSTSANDKEISLVFQYLWSKAVNNPNYSKKEWNWLFNQLQLKLPNSNKPK